MCGGRHRGLENGVKVSVTQSGVTFSQMSPHLAECLLDIVRDLASGDAVLIYGPGYEVPVVRPKDDLRDLLDGMVRADAHYPGALTDQHDDADWWDAQPFSLGVLEHRDIWHAIEKTKGDDKVFDMLTHVDEERD